jgi:hypothetical protein
MGGSGRIGCVIKPVYVAMRAMTGPRRYRECHSVTRLNDHRRTIPMEDG